MDANRRGGAVLAAPPRLTPVHNIKLTETRRDYALPVGASRGPGEVSSKLFLFWERPHTERTQPGTCWLLSRKKGEGKQWLRKSISLLSTNMSRIAGRPRGSTWTSMC